MNYLKRFISDEIDNDSEYTVSHTEKKGRVVHTSGYIYPTETGINIYNSERTNYILKEKIISISKLYAS